MIPVDSRGLGFPSEVSARRRLFKFLFSLGTLAIYAGATVGIAEGRKDQLLGPAIAAGGVALDGLAIRVWHRTRAMEQSTNIDPATEVPVSAFQVDPVSGISPAETTVE